MDLLNYKLKFSRNRDINFIKPEPTESPVLNQSYSSKKHISQRMDII